jgi:hypothetical protein
VAIYGWTGRRSIGAGISSRIGRAAGTAPGLQCETRTVPDPRGMAALDVKADKPLGELASPLPMPDPVLSSIAG